MSLSRRTVLGAGLGAAAGALVGCGRPPAPPPPTVASLVRADPFYVAHRGGGGNWPEMTAYAYEQAAALRGLQALEISVCITKDKVLVCSHDPDTARLTERRYVIAEQTWETLSSLTVSPEETTDPGQPRRPLTRFDDIVDRYIGTHVLFVEPKVSQAGDQLMRRMDGLGQPERVVWKQPVNSARFELAKQRGFTTWGYVLDEPGHQGAKLRRYAASPDVDLLGARLDDPAAPTVVAAARAEGKGTIMWPIRDPEDAATAVELGFDGLMCSRPRDLLPA